MFYQPALDAVTVPLYPAALRAAERPCGLLSPSLPFLNPTQKHTAPRAMPAGMRADVRPARPSPAAAHRCRARPRDPPLPAALMCAQTPATPKPS